jgi:hypothetical protein
MKRFVLYSVYHGHVYQFDTAHDVAIFMHGKTPHGYQFYVRAFGVPLDAFEIKQFLEQVSGVAD